MRSHANSLRCNYVFPLTMWAPPPGLSGAKELDFCRFTVVEEATPETRVPAGRGPAEASQTFYPGDLLDGVALSDVSRDPESTRPITSPHIDVAHLDLLRWKLALLAKERPPQSSVAARIRNFPRFDEPTEHWPLFLGFGIIGLAYGGLHCLAWNAPFPTDLERLFWRVSSVTVTSTGALIALAFTWVLSPPVIGRETHKALDMFTDLGRKVLPVAGVEWAPQKVIEILKSGRVSVRVVPFFVLLFLKVTFDAAIVALIIFYTLARIYLVVECFINIAHLPDGAYQMPQWSQYVPHIA